MTNLKQEAQRAIELSAVAVGIEHVNIETMKYVVGQYMDRATEAERARCAEIAKDFRLLHPAYGKERGTCMAIASAILAEGEGK